MSSFGQFASTTQFYLYGRQYCTADGFKRNMKKFYEGGKVKDILKDSKMSLEGKVAMVTGANSGVGYEVAKFLASKKATVVMVCRSKQRAEDAAAAIRKETGCETVKVLLADLSLETEVRRAWDEFKGAAPLPQLDILVCNAGVLLNEKTLSSEGVEMTFGCHLLFGTYLLGSLAIPALEATQPGSRLIVVSSGGMYNTKVPEFSILSGRSVTEPYSGNMAYAYCKRAQVVLCERWAKRHPAVKFVTTHPGWTLTPAVDAAYGDQKRYLEPMRTPWEGADGIAWLCVAPAEAIEDGAFYLDRVPRTKHIAGPFFTEGSFTKNTAEELDDMERGLEQWSRAATRPALPTADEELALQAEALALKAKLVEMAEPIETARFMGRWFVQGGVPTYFEKGMMNAVEDYTFNEAKGCIDVVFSMAASPTAKPTVLLQRATISNKATNTKWSISPKFGVYMPIGLTYLVIDVDLSDYSTCMVGVPDRSYLWIMARTATIEPSVYDGLVKKAVRLGYERKNIIRVAHDYSQLEGKSPLSAQAVRDSVPAADGEALPEGGNELPQGEGTSKAAAEPESASF